MSSVALPERCYAMDVSYPLLVIGTAEKHIVIIKCVLIPFSRLCANPQMSAYRTLPLYTKHVAEVKSYAGISI